jgi:hypothetical protein
MYGFSSKEGPFPLFTFKPPVEDPVDREEPKPTNNPAFNNSNSGGKNYKATALSVEYIAEFEMIVISNSEMELMFWDCMTQVFEDKNKFNPPRFIESVRTKDAILKMSWCEPAKTLCCMTSSSTMLLMPLHLIRPDVKLRLGAPVIVGKGVHTEILQDIVCVDEFSLICSASLDGQICVWDAFEHTLIGVRVGHSGGVRCLCYCGEGILLSGGFDFDILAWDVSGASMDSLL